MVYKRNLRQERKKAIHALESAAKRMRQADSVTRFIDELLTEDEKVTLGRRLLISRMILEGKTQAEIRYELGVSPNTFTRTRKWLIREIPEYDKVLKAHKLKQKEKTDQKVKQYRPRPRAFSFADLKRRYPMHFLLFNLADELFHNTRSLDILKDIKTQK